MSDTYTRQYLTKEEDLELNVFDGIVFNQWMQAALDIMEKPITDWDDPQLVSGEFEAK